MIKNQRENGTPLLQKMVKQFEETGHLAFKGTSALNRGKWVKGKTKTPFITMENLSLWSSCYRIMHTANQLCVYGAVTNWCETLGRTESEKVLRNRNMNTEEISSLVKIPRAPPASGEPNASETSKFQVSFSEKSTQTSSWKSNTSSSSGEDLVLSDSFWCWRWMREPHPNVQRTPSSSWTSWI